MRCSSFRLLLVAVAAAIHTPPVGGSRQAVAAEVAPVDALPADMNQIESLTLEQAKKLAAEFTGVRVLINDNDCTSIVESSLPLNGLNSLDADIAKALAEFKGRLLTLNGLNSLDAATAKALAQFKGKSLSVSGLTTLDAATAKALAEFKGFGLYLNGLTTLDADIAKALAEFKGKVLKLNGLTTLDADTAKALAGSTAWNGQLPKLTTLDADIAKTLAALNKWDGDLSSIVAFESPDSVEIAATLAKRKEKIPLRLPNLKKISPKTLTALIEKEDVEIPLLDTLELIQEPDGGPTEDFVIPEGFQERQKFR